MITWHELRYKVPDYNELVFIQTEHGSYHIALFKGESKFFVFDTYETGDEKLNLGTLDESKPSFMEGYKIEWIPFDLISNKTTTRNRGDV